MMQARGKGKEARHFIQLCQSLETRRPTFAGAARTPPSFAAGATAVTLPKMQAAILCLS